MMDDQKSTQWPPCPADSTFRDEIITNDLQSGEAPSLIYAFNINLRSVLYVLSPGDIVVSEKR